MHNLFTLFISFDTTALLSYSYTWYHTQDMLLIYLLLNLFEMSPVAQLFFAIFTKFF